MKNNSLQFAVVREDPHTAAAVLSRCGKSVSKAMLIGSGGCTVLSLASAFPGISFTVLDKNLAQLDHIKKKLDALGKGHESNFKAQFNIGIENECGLNDCGNFESLFRGFRRLIHDLVCPYSDLKRAFEDHLIANQSPTILFQEKFWPVAFDLFFSDSILNAMFGADATQHATKGSYPSYFQKVLEQGLQRADSHSNYFLHHILLGHYLENKDTWPLYLQKPPIEPLIELVHGGVEDEILDLQSFDFIDLSNLFDWMPKKEIEKVALTISTRMKTGAFLVFRQLNNNSDLKSCFPHLVFDEMFENDLLQKDRSLFYCRIKIGAKTCRT